MLTLCRHCR